MKKIVLVLCLILFTSVLFAESAPDTLWTRTFARDEDDKAYSVQQTTDGGYIMVGRTKYPGDINYDAWLIKTDENGDSLWSKTYGDYYVDEAYVVRQTSDGGYIIGGMSTQFGWAGEGWLIRTDDQGDVIWQYGYHAEGTTTSNWDYIYDVVEMDDGGFIAAGHTAMAGYTHQGWVIRVTAKGKEMWNKHYGGAYWDRLFVMRPTHDGNYIVAGDMHVLEGTDTNAWLMKISPDGDSLWSTTFGGDGTDQFRALCVNEDGTFVCGGITRSYGLADYAGWLVKTDHDGNLIWNKRYRYDENYSCIHSVIETPDHRNVSGGVIFYPATSYDAWLFSTNSDGDVVWEREIYVTDLEDDIQCVERTTDGGYILGGHTNGHSLDGDFWLVKTGPDLLSVHDEMNNNVTLSNFPNPIHNTTKIQYSIKGSLHSSPVEILIYNTKGQLVDSVEGENGTAVWDAQTHSNGIYYYKISHEKSMIINKMIVLH